MTEEYHCPYCGQKGLTDELLDNETEEVDPVGYVGDCPSCLSPIFSENVG
jgi:RNA polymerase subunit RPABC4/transcription elongation factor Spt4